MQLKNSYHLLLLLLVLFVGLSTHAQPKLEVSGDVPHPLSLSIATLQSFPVYIDSIIDRDKKKHAFKSVNLIDVLKKAGAPYGQQMRGENVVKIVLITAADGYQAVYSLAEVDPEFSGRNVRVAFEKNGKPLPEGEGPFRLIAPADLKMSRWVREVRSIRIVYPKE